MLKKLTAIFLVSLIPHGTMFAGVQPDLQSAIENSSFDELLLQSRPIEDAAQLSTLSQALWEKYRSSVLNDPIRQKEQQDKSLSYKDKTMRFSLAKRGEKPATGYPLYIALHGGGQAPASTNNSQWEAMKVYYRDSVDTGIYVATRGVTDTWNLHFVDESYPLYDHLIENLIAFEDVDPNRVYIMGFSAGGDGVYQIAPRMADRWAAANMSAGHHNWITFDNLYSLPFLIQVGQNDSAYSRNKVAVENSLELDRLAGLRGGYKHDAFVHRNGSHNSWRDNDSNHNPQPVLADPEAWLKGGSSAILSLNTNAVDWLKDNVRDAYAPKLYWDPQVNAKERLVSAGSAYLQDDTAKAALSKTNRLFYWLDLGPNALEIPKGVIESSYSKESNTIALHHLGGLDHLRVLVHQDMLDFGKPVAVTVDDVAIGSLDIKPDLQIMTRTLLERGDANYIFAGQVELSYEDGKWTLEP